MSKPIHILNIAGARPNFMKLAPLMKAFAAADGIDASLVHTGQHYDKNMSQLFFDELGIPEPDVNLEVGSASHAVQTADIMTSFEPVLAEIDPDAVLVVGDVNSTVACGLVAVKSGKKLIHVEAGLRSFDRSMPEEINRIVTDSLSDILFCTEQSGVDNLRNDGVDESRIKLVGNVMIDSLLEHREKAAKSDVLERTGLEKGAYAVLTMHRPANLEDTEVLSGIVGALIKISAELPIVFPVHPRTRKAMVDAGLLDRFENASGVTALEPLGYLDFLKLTSEAGLMLTDSGGIQEETTILGVPCITLRENTERPSTVEMGTNRIVGRDPAAILAAFNDVRANPPSALIPPLWDGHAAERIASEILSALS